MTRNGVVWRNRLAARQHLHGVLLRVALAMLLDVVGSSGRYFVLLHRHRALARGV